MPNQLDENNNPVQQDKKFILVVEDDQPYAKIFQNKLQKAGYEVKIAADGDQAWQIVNDYKPDLILLDMIMPVMDGLTILKKLKDDDRYKDISVIIISNFGFEDDREKAKAMGANEYLIKSNTSIKELTKLVDKYLNPNFKT